MSASDNLAEMAAVYVTFLILIVVSLLALYMLILHSLHFKYPAAQQFLFIIFLMPLLIGWASWVELLNSSKPRALEFLMSLFKSFCLAAFMLYTERMLGWVHLDGKNIYSPKKKFETLCTAKQTTRFLRCFKINPIKNEAEAKTYMHRIQVMVYQACIVLTLLGIAGGVMLLIMGVDDLKETDYEVYFEIFLKIKGASSLVALLALLHFGLYANKLPEMEPFIIIHKFIIIKLGILFTEVQPLIIQPFADAKLIVESSAYSTDEVVSYTNSLLLCSEMIIVNFLLVLIFPVSDYDPRTELKEILINKDD